MKILWIGQDRGLQEIGRLPVVQWLLDYAPETHIITDQRYALISSPSHAGYEIFHQPLITVHGNLKEKVDACLCLWDEPLLILTCKFLFDALFLEIKSLAMAFDGSIPDSFILFSKDEPIVMGLSKKDVDRLKIVQRDSLGFSNGFWSEFLSSLPSIKVPAHIEAWKWSLCSTEEELNAFRDFLPSQARRVKEIADPLPPIVTKSFARVGLVGNPSDGFFGRTISFLISNFYAQVWLTPNPFPSDASVRLDLNDLTDPRSFRSLDQGYSLLKKDGYYGVSRLFFATVKVFCDYCHTHNLYQHKRGFSLKYTTNIPRQVGLSGSSAFVTAILKALVIFYNLQIPLHIQANLALSAERDELGISAGHQDRVIQVYGGCVFMDFDKKGMMERGYGIYERIPVSLLPSGLWIGNYFKTETYDSAYLGKPKESGKVHNDIKARFNSGDVQVIEAMHTFADYASQAKEAILSQDYPSLAKLMNRNFDLRRKLYGDEIIGSANLEMIQIARAHGHAAKFCGSGGCIVGLWDGSLADETRLAKTRSLQMTLLQRGFVYCGLDLAHESY